MNILQIWREVSSIRNQLLEELAGLYGIEVLHNPQGNGDLYYVDSDDVMKEINTIFEEKSLTHHRGKSSNMSTGYQKSPLKCGDWADFTE